MSLLVDADTLKKSFGSIEAVSGISLKVNRGEVLGFLGPNGAGKSTTMKMLTGFLRPDHGSATICGHDIVSDAKRAKQNIGYLPEGAPSYGEMTAKAFLQFLADIRGFDGRERDVRVDAAIDKTGLGSVIDQSIETLSKGFKRRVGLAGAILHDPPVLIMDEPTDGLDPNQKHQVRGLITQMAKDKAIIVSTHILEEVEAVCSRAIVIDRGRIVADGTAEDLQKRMAYHNAVAIKVPSAVADRVREQLQGIAAVLKVETTGQSNGVTALRALPRDGRSIAADVAALMREKSISVDEMVVERGRLEDVFRQITSQDLSSNAGRSNA